MASYSAPRAAIRSSAVSTVAGIGARGIKDGRGICGTWLGIPAVAAAVPGRTGSGIRFPSTVVGSGRVAGAAGGGAATTGVAATGAGALIGAAGVKVAGMSRTLTATGVGVGGRKLGVPIACTVGIPIRVARGGSIGAAAAAGAGGIATGAGVGRPMTPRPCGVLADGGGTDAGGRAGTTGAAATATGVALGAAAAGVGAETGAAAATAGAAVAPAALPLASAPTRSMID